MKHKRNSLLDYNWKREQKIKNDNELFWDTLFIATFIALIFIGWGFASLGGNL